MSQSYGLHLTFRTDSAMKRVLKAIARKKYLTLTQVILEALREKIERERGREDR